MTTKQKDVAKILLQTYLEDSMHLLDEFNAPAKDYQKLKTEAEKFATILEIEAPEFDWEGLL